MKYVVSHKYTTPFRYVAVDKLLCKVSYVCKPGSSQNEGTSCIAAYLACMVTHHLCFFELSQEKAMHAWQDWHMLIDSKGTEITVNLEGSKFSRIAIFENFIEIILRIHCLNHAHAAHVSIAPECCPSALLHENCGSR